MGDDGNPPQGTAPIKEVTLSGSAARTKLTELMERMSTRADQTQPREHKFWRTQPVPQHGAKNELEQLGDRGSPIETKEVKDVAQNPFPLLDSFEWSQIDVTDFAQLGEVYRLLNENYVEDGDAMFRFDYSREFLKWALQPPGWRPEWHVGVRVKGSGRLVAFITAIPACVHIHADPLQLVEINFLCVHKKLRSKRLAPVLIREITRRVNLENIWQAVYTAGALLPRPVSSSRYFHRSLNPKKLIEVGFSRLQPRMTMARTIKLYSVKSDTTIPGIRLLKPTDVPAACAVLNEYFSSFDMRVEMSEAEFAHWFLPRDKVIYTYVVEGENGKITDLASYYSLPSSVINHPTHKTLYAAYAFCCAALSTTPTDLMRDVLVMAHKNGFDVFNALELANHGNFFQELKFHPGDGELHYYLYNWKCRPVSSEKNALVLL